MESYLQSAWYNLRMLLDFMANTVILTVQGVNVTFLGLLVCTMIIDILIWVVFVLIDVSDIFG